MSHAEGEGSRVQATRIAAFFQSLSARAERDPQLAAILAACLEESGLIAVAAARNAEAERAATRQTRRRASARTNTNEARPETLDPFSVWRAQGEEALRRALEEMGLQELRIVVRAHRLDPARVSSRWTARDRVIALILEQVKARLNHGRAFERV